MQIGVVGLGRMGGNIVRRLRSGGHDCVVYDADTTATEGLVREGATGAEDLAQLVDRLQPPRAVWVMVPAGDPTDEAVNALGGLLEAGDTVIDGGNSYFQDDIRRAGHLAGRNIRYLDVGTSGGVWGLERGFCLMIGGDPDAVERLAPIFSTLAPGPARDDTAPEGLTRTTAARGFLHCGPTGAGHFVKMVHNGIEYGLMQAYAEGFDILATADGSHLPEVRRYDFDLAAIAELWRHGSVISSWLLDLTGRALAESPDLAEFTGRVEDSGEGRWTVTTAVEQAVPAPVLTAALFARFRSRRERSFADRLLSAMRLQFGGHVEPPSHPSSRSGA